MAEPINYEITITKKETVIKKVQERVRTSDTGNPQGDGPVYDWTPVEREQVIVTQILSQTIEGDGKVDIKNVIKAINGI